MNHNNNLQDFEVDEKDFEEFNNLYIKLLSLNKKLHDANSSIMKGDVNLAEDY